MSVAREVKKKKKKKEVKEELTWQQKKMTMDKEEEMIKQEVEELTTWTNMIEAMDENQLKEYVMHIPENMKNVKTVKAAPTKRVRRSTGTKPKCSTSCGIMSVVWKYHREDDEEAPVNSSLE